MLKFSRGNSKLKAGEVIFDLPAGHSCPFADKCLSFADPTTGRITDGPNSEFRCYAASLEVVYKNARLARWHNFESLKGLSVTKMKDLIINSMMGGYLYRLHSSGDFFSLNYFDAWVEVARLFPDKIFYAYTKALPFWIKRKNTLPKNFRLVASWGGKFDNLITEHKLKSARVVFSQAEADKLGLEIDDNDEHAWKGKKSFALLIHGTQPAKTPASVAWQLVKANEGGYGKKGRTLIPA